LGSPTFVMLLFFVTLGMEKQKCTHCSSNCTKKNGSTHYGKQNYFCHACGRQFVDGGQDWFIGDEKKKIIKNLLKERLSLEGISRSCGVSITWLYNFIDEEYKQSPDDLNVVITPIEEEEYLAARFDEEIERLKKKSQIKASDTQK